MNDQKTGPPIRFYLIKFVNAVKLQEHPGSSLRSPTEILVEIPAGAVVELEAAPAPSGLCNILWKGNAYSVFYEELRENARLHEAAG